MEGDINFRMVRLARELRGLTQKDVSDRGGPDQARLSRIETGRAPAAADDVDRLALALDLPVSFFFETGTPAAAPLFRRRAIRSARQLAEIQARLNTAVLIAQRLLASDIEIDPPHFFPMPGEFPPDEPERAAKILRRDWHLPSGRVDDLIRVIEDAAGIVLRVDFGTTDASAAYLPMPHDERFWFLVNSREDSGERVRLSLAHELGHAVLHRMLPSIDEAETEAQAFRFAAGFLLPPDEFDQQVSFDTLTLSEARSLKRAFHVSIQAIIRAAFERELISRKRYSSLYKQLSARQWRTQEPDPLPLEVPQTWPEIVRIHREEHGYSDEELAEIAQVSAPLLGELFPEQFRRRPSLRPVTVTSRRDPVPTTPRRRRS